MDLAGLIVGLGNPGETYAGTRHNFGFLVIDALAQAGRGERLKSVKKLYDLDRVRIEAASSWLLAKPLTFMNVSGKAVAQICNFYKIEPAQVVVVHDELDLPLGRMKFKFGGGAAGHNGVKSIAACLGSQDFHRLRLGVGKPLHGDTVSYVLSRFTTEELDIVRQVVEAATSGLTALMAQGPASVIQRFNSFKVQAAHPEG
jgi:PTH1 family peptidyl-tRNA hydrolase